MRAIELHASAKTIQRSHGRSSVAASAYRAGVKLYDERTGLTHDYSRRGGVEFARIYLPDNAPESFRDRERLWNAVEKKENRSNSCTARELEFAFPYEFNAMQRREAGDAVSQELMQRYGCAVDIAFHSPSPDGDHRNYHAHVLFTDRAFDSESKDGWARNKYRDLSNDQITINGKKTTRGKQEILSLRKFTAGVLNNIAERDNLSVTVEYLSFEARGVDCEPQIHLGAVANDMKKKGNQSERHNDNQKIISINQKKDKISKAKEVETLDKFDEFAGTKRAAFQSWSNDEKIEEDRRCDAEMRKLEKKLYNFYGRNELKYREETKGIKNRLNGNVLTNVIGNLTGSIREDKLRLEQLSKNLDNIEMRKNEQRAQLLKIQKDRDLEMQKRHDKAEVDIEEYISKTRSSYAEGETEGNGDQQGGAVAGKNHRPKNRSSYKPAKKTRESDQNRTVSYSGNGMDKREKSKLNQNHTDSTNSTRSKRKHRPAPERDFTPPKPPSLGR